MWKVAQKIKWVKHIAITEKTPGILRKNNIKLLQKTNCKTPS